MKDIVEKTKMMGTIARGDKINLNFLDEVILQFDTEDDLILVFCSALANDQILDILYTQEQALVAVGEFDFPNPEENPVVYLLNSISSFDFFRCGKTIKGFVTPHFFEPEDAALFWTEKKQVLVQT